MPVGYGAACALWRGRLPVRLLVAALLVAACRLPGLGVLPVLVAMPALAALRRVPRGVGDEVLLAGGGVTRLALLLLRPAGWGLAAGAVLAAVSPWAGLCALAAAAAPLAVALPRGGPGAAGGWS